MAGKVILSAHAARRIKERYVDEAEVAWAIANADIQHPGPTPGTVNVVCDMALGRRLKVSYAMTSAGDYYVVTVFWKEGQP